MAFAHGVAKASTSDLSHHINYSADGGCSQDDWDLGHKIRRVWDY